FFQAEDGIRDFHVTGVQTCALPISEDSPRAEVCRPDPSRNGPDPRSNGVVGATGFLGPLALRPFQCRVLSEDRVVVTLAGLTGDAGHMHGTIRHTVRRARAATNAWQASSRPRTGRRPVPRRRACTRKIRA